MVIDIELFNNTPPKSTKKILCQCDECGRRAYLQKYNITNKKYNQHYRCKSCHCRHMAIRFTVNDNFFSVPNIINSYWAGFIAADGCIEDDKTLSFGLQLSDSSHLDRLVKDSEYTGNVYPYKEKNTARLKISSRKWISDLMKNYNIGRRKTKHLLPPHSLSNEQSLAFITGFIDGDGTISKQQKKYIFLQIVGLENILQWVLSVLKDNGLILKHGCDYIHPHSSIYKMRITGSKILPILKQIYQLSLPFMERKWGLLNQYD